jgi:hypothetical protein
VVASRSEPSDKPVPGQRGGGGGTRERREHRDSVPEPAREDVHTDQPGLQRRVRGEGA